MPEEMIFKTKRYTVGGLHLLDTIRWFLMRFGNAPDVDELTHLLRQTPMPVEAGFAFGSFAAGFVTLRVPPQNPAEWYVQKNRFSPKKQWIAGMIAEKHKFSLSENFMAGPGLLFPTDDQSSRYHFLELSNDLGTIIAAHPDYLKVRLLKEPPRERLSSDLTEFTPLAPDLLEDFSLLYKPKEER